MKLKYYIMFIGAAALMGACSPDNVELFDFSNYQVDKVVCQAESNFLVADGVSQLKLEVKLYTKTGEELDKSGNVVREFFREIQPSRWRDHDIKFFTEDGTQVQTPYITQTANPSKLRFYATVDGMRSSEPIRQLAAIYAGDASAVQVGPVYFDVNVREAIPVPAKKRIPVIFHLVDTEHNKNVGQILSSDAVDYVINLWNNVFSRQFDVASNGANPNLEFVPALRTPAGKRLEEPGINRVLLSEAQMADLVNEQVDFVWNNSDMLYWDCDRYLNVWVFFSTIAPSTYLTLKRGFPTVYEEGVFDETAFPLPTLIRNDLRHLSPENMEAWKANPGSVISDANYLEKVGILFTKANFATRRLDYITPMSIYLGVINNTAYSESSHRFFGNGTPWLDDQCQDTPVYDIWFWGTPSNGGVEAAGLGTSHIKHMRHAPWSIFGSSNIVEYPNSFQTTITQDQSKRIEWVLQNAGARQAWKNTSAID